MNNIDARFLKKLIREMIEKKSEIVEDCGCQDMEGGDEPVEASATKIDPDGYEGFMAKGNLYKMAKSASELHDLIADNENLEPWVEEKIAVAARMIDDVADYMEYAKKSNKR